MKLIKTFSNFKNERKHFRKPLIISCSGPVIGIVIFLLGSIFGSFIMGYSVTPYMIFAVLMLILPIICTAYGINLYDPSKHRSRKSIGGLRATFMLIAIVVTIVLLGVMFMMCSSDISIDSNIGITLAVGSAATIITTIVSYFSYH